MKKKYFKSPDKGFEDFEPNNLKNQSSQTFFRIKTPCNTLKNSSTSHCRTQTQTFPENDSKNDYFTGI